MKILLDGRLISNKPTGISRYSREIIKIYQDYFGYDNIMVIVNENLDSKTFNLIYTDLKPFTPHHFFLFNNFLKKLDFDIYHSLYHCNSFFKDKNKFYITTIHDVGYKAINCKIHLNPVRNFLTKVAVDFILKRTLKNSDLVITVSQSTRDDILRFYNKDSIHIPEGVNIIPGKEIPIKSLKPKSFFLYVGNSRPTKNLNFLLEAFSKSKTEKTLVIAGNNNFLQVDRERVQNLGFVSDEELNWLYSNCEAFIFPSLYEGFGLPVLEALHKGAKVYCSTGGSLKEFSNSVVKHFDPYDLQELIFLIENSDSIAFEKNEINLILEMYSWNNVNNLMINKIFNKL
ncbi:glycosyltransferase family 1 protein [Cetobacterium sp. 2G large]|uniref:glycosyltransferase family 4 protein n=1 Tax=Cetobacterium sp. 2G large TaxID=2759680 RepID=UPI00163C70D5|nr:glycosyltransferase family 1 protein [Cetobacterium sp. 2G large]MBC2852329.1 glycosyltransferase family 4 protein [Cetobacterium sp. 2G large]